MYCSTGWSVWKLSKINYYWNGHFLLYLRASRLFSSFRKNLYVFQLFNSTSKNISKSSNAFWLFQQQVKNASILCHMLLFLTIFIRNPLYCNYSLYACFIAIKKQGDLRSITSQPLDTPCTHSSTMRCSMYAAKLTYKWSSDNAKHSVPQNV